MESKGLTGLGLVGKTIEHTSYSVYNGEHIIGISFEGDEKSYFLVSQSEIKGFHEDDLES